MVLVNIGTIYSDGNGVQQDYVAAMKYYKKAADAGEPAGTGNMGIMYYEGKGVPMDKELGIKLLKEASDACNGCFIEYMKTNGIE
jgi:uncharacterized protein